MWTVFSELESLRGRALIKWTRFCKTRIMFVSIPFWWRILAALGCRSGGVRKVWFVNLWLSLLLLVRFLVGPDYDFIIDPFEFFTLSRSGTGWMVYVPLAILEELLRIVLTRNELLRSFLILANSVTFFFLLSRISLGFSCWAFYFWFVGYFVVPNCFLVIAFMSTCLLTSKKQSFDRFLNWLN